MSVDKIDGGLEVERGGLKTGREQPNIFFIFPLLTRQSLPQLARPIQRFNSARGSLQLTATLNFAWIVSDKSAAKTGEMIPKQTPYLIAIDTWYYTTL